jgi:hypothetical protein
LKNSSEPDVHQNTASHLILWPPPQRQTLQLQGSINHEHHDEFANMCVFSNSKHIVVSFTAVGDISTNSASDLENLAEISGLTQTLTRFGLQYVLVRAPATADIRLSINSSICPGRHRYSLQIFSDFISIIASDRCGLLYGVYTLVQIIQLHSQYNIFEKHISREDYQSAVDFDSTFLMTETQQPKIMIIKQILIPCLRIEDWPDSPTRAFTWPYHSSAMTSISTISGIIALMSKLHLNQLFIDVECEMDESVTVNASSAISVDEESNQNRKNLIFGSRIHEIELLCTSHCVGMYNITMLLATLDFFVQI